VDEYHSSVKKIAGSHRYTLNNSLPYSMPSSSITTFVTALLDIGSSNSEWRYEFFQEVVHTGLPLCVFISPCFLKRVELILENQPHVHLFPTIELSELWMYSIWRSFLNIDPQRLCLPQIRNETKDTAEYMLANHAKIEFIKRAIEENPWNTRYFAWIDFSLPYIFKESAATLKDLERFAYGPPNFPRKILAIPGCWEKGEYDRVQRICWRFCGGFFLGDRESLMDFYECYRRFFWTFLKEERTLVWEVNFWAYLETKSSETGLHFQWYKADHDDTIITAFPPEWYAIVLARIVHPSSINTLVQYEYPALFNEGFTPSSAAYLEYDGKRYLNTRFVNYRIGEDGRYEIHHPEKKLVTRNVVSELDAETWLPLYYKVVDEPVVQRSGQKCRILGLEDVRLFAGKHCMHFVATSQEYSVDGKGLVMVVGDYYPNLAKMTRISAMGSPKKDSVCEKNWIPLGGDRFIYQWSPMQIGELRNGALRIVKTYHTPAFMGIRGSSVFLEDGTRGPLIGVVHFSVDLSDGRRNYFHRLLQLNRETWMPEKMTPVFVFTDFDIEYCIGFSLDQSMYRFWISRRDRDPCLVTIGRDKMGWVDV